jgi:LacI family transcriptional regulator
LLWSETITQVRERVQQPDMATTIVMGYPIPDRDCVCANLEVGVRAALEHLQSQGCTRIGYFAPSHAIRREGDPRYDLYCHYIAEQKQEARVFSYEGSAFDVAAARQRAEALAADPERPDALLCFNDMAAIGALMGLRRQGLRIPEDVALVGCDDLPLAAQLDVALTSIHYPLEELCQRAVELLMERIDGQEPIEQPLSARRVELPTTLRIRESSRVSRQGRDAQHD